MQDLETEKYRLELIKHLVGPLAAAGHAEDELARRAISIADAVIRALVSGRVAAGSPQ
jgi:hypothetical protein